MDFLQLPPGSTVIFKMMHSKGWLDIATEEELVAAVLRKDKDAFRILIQRYEKLVMLIVFRMVKQQADREDLCQEVFLKVYEKLDSFRFDSKLSSWIGKIAYNHCINFLQKSKALLGEDWLIEQERKETAVQFSMREGPMEKLLSKERQKLLRQLIEELPPLQQTVISLFHQQELSLQEISDITDLPVNTVKSHLHRGRQALKNKWQTI